MLKKQEELSQGSCWNKAEVEEPVFILLGRDESAPTAIWAWIRERVITGKNKEEDAEIKEAMNLALQMHQWRMNRKQQKGRQQ